MSKLIKWCFQAKLSRRSNLRKGSRVWSSSREFYDPSTAPFDNCEPQETVENQLEAREKPLIGNSNFGTKNNVQCQTETFNISSNFASSVETTDVGVQIESCQEENDNIQFFSEQVVAEVIDNAFMDVLSHPDIPTKSEVLCKSCLDDLNSQLKILKTEKEEDNLFITIEAFSKSFVDQLIPSLLQKLEDCNLLQYRNDFEDFGSFLPWFMEQFEMEARKLECLCQKMERSLTH